MADRNETIFDAYRKGKAGKFPLRRGRREFADNHLSHFKSWKANLKRKQTREREESIELSFSFSFVLHIQITPSPLIHLSRWMDHPPHPA